MRILRISRIRFIILKVSLIMNFEVLHANIIIYDKIKNTVIRFEPYGKLDVVDEQYLDKMIKKIFIKAVRQDITYICPGDYLKNQKFQAVSMGDTNKNLGDPVGYCLAWCFWFIELKLKNPDEDDKTLVENAMEKIILMGKDDPMAILTFIRGYGRKLDDEKNNMFRKIGIDNSEIYSLTYTDSKLIKIKKYIEKFVIKLL